MHVLPSKRTVKWLCYVFDTPVGHSQRLLLLSMSAIKLSGIYLAYDSMFITFFSAVNEAGKSFRDPTLRLLGTFACGLLTSILAFPFR